MKDSDLIQIVDAAMAEAVRVSGEWIACKIGCTECCIGPFPITQLDAARLQEGMADLDSRDSGRAARIRERARKSIERIGLLDDDSGADECFSALAEEEPCPALDLATGACDLYQWRPITCRTFGPAVSWGAGALGVCELCYQGATEDEIAACSVDLDPGLETALVDDFEVRTGRRGQSTVALALVTAPTASDCASPLERSRS